MRTALNVVRPQATNLALAQSAWEQFFEDALAEFDEPNKNLCHDLALDKTLRALGPRPRGPLMEKEREDLAVQHEVEQLIADSSRRPNYGKEHWGRE